jgi:hypothetical protein
VLKADWSGPDIDPKLADFCRHCGIHVVPRRPGETGQLNAPFAIWQRVRDSNPCTGLERAEVSR